MRAIFTSFALISILHLSAQELPPLNQMIQDPVNRFMVNYPEGWTIQKEDIGGYILRIVAPEEAGSVYIKVTNVGQSIPASTIVNKYIVPAWIEDGATVIEQPEDIKVMTSAQLATRQVDSGYSCLLKMVESESVQYIGYNVLSKGNYIYEIKYQGFGNAPVEVVKLLPKISLSLVTL